MPGLPKELIEHALKVDSKVIPKKQRLRRLSPDKREAIKKELAKLLAAGFIKEVYHPDWLANPVLIQMKNNNVGADVLSKLGSTRAAVPPGVFVHELHHPPVKEQSQQVTDTEAPAAVREVLMIEEDWRTQFIDFIKEFKLPPHVDS